MTTGSREFGAWAEEEAARYLRGVGFEILARNYRCREGEIDLVACEGGVLAFVEVKGRRGRGYGLPAAAVGARKQRRLLRAASRFLSEHRVRAQRLRFDVVSVLASGAGSSPRIELIRGAFDAG